MGQFSGIFGICAQGNWFGQVSRVKTNSSGNGMNKAATEKAYHHGDLRQALVDAACRHLLESGADTLSLRALARELGVSQTAPYRHFESKNALFAAVASHGFMLLVDQLNTAQKMQPDTRESLIEVGLAYIRWSETNPEKYQLCFDSSILNFEAELVFFGISF